MLKSDTLAHDREDRPAGLADKPSQMTVFDALYSIAAGDGRDKALFGNSIDIARDVYERTLIGSGNPAAYVEFTLLGAPGFDLLSVHASVEPGSRFAPGAGFGRQAMFDWFSGACNAKDDVSCGIELDTSVGETEQAGVYLQYRDHSDLIAPFLDSIGERDRMESFLAVSNRMPEGWPPAYIGLFPGREGTPLRIGGYLGQAVQKACASDPSLLATQFCQVGFSAYNKEMLSRCAEFMALAPTVDFQFDIMPDGSLGDVFGLSLSFNETKPRQASAGEDAREEWKVFIRGEMESELDAIISEENLRHDETVSYMAVAFAEGHVNEDGTAVTKILKPRSRFGKNAGHADSKSRALTRLKAYFEKYREVAPSVSYEAIEMESEEA